MKGVLIDDLQQVKAIMDSEGIAIERQRLPEVLVDADLRRRHPLLQQISNIYTVKETGLGLDLARMATR